MLPQVLKNTFCFLLSSGCISPYSWSSWLLQWL
jgi:hypothetical protein